MAQAFAIQHLASTLVAWTRIARQDIEVISPQEAWAASCSGDLRLIDIRTLAEMRDMGIPEGAMALDMRAPDFVARIEGLLAEAPDVPLAFISAVSGRTTWLVRRLRKAGFTNVLNVVEGIFGSPDGPGWIARGLPMASPPARADLPA